MTYPFGSASRVQPYLLGGIGVYHMTISVTSADSTVDNSATKFAWNLGGGIGLRVRGTTLFLEARYIGVGAVSGFPRTTFLPITLLGLWSLSRLHLHLRDLSAPSPLPGSEAGTA